MAGRYLDTITTEGDFSADEDEDMGDVACSDDEGFLDDGSDEETLGPPPGAMEAARANEVRAAERTPEREPCRACPPLSQKRAHTCGRGKGSKAAPPPPAPDAPDGAPGAVEEEKVREIIPIPQKGLGRNCLVDRIPLLGALVTPYFKQSLIGPNGPWERRETLEWFRNSSEQLEYAQLFHRPLTDETATRRLASHVSDDKPWVNSSSRVLHTMICTHEQTELDKKLGARPAAPRAPAH